MTAFGDDLHDVLREAALAGVSWRMVLGRSPESLPVSVGRVTAGV